MFAILSPRTLTLKLCQTHSQLTKVHSASIKRYLSSHFPKRHKAFCNTTLIKGTSVGIGGVALGAAIGFFKVPEIPSRFKIYADTTTYHENFSGNPEEKNAKETTELPSDSGIDENESTNTSQKKEVVDEERFDWPQLIEIISPYWKRLTVAVGVCLEIWNIFMKLHQGYYFKIFYTNIFTIAIDSQHLLWPLLILRSQPFWGSLLTLSRHS